MKNERKICQIGFCYPRFSEAKLLSPILNTTVIIIFKPLWRVYWYFFGESYSISIPYYLVVLYLTFIHHPLQTTCYYQHSLKSLTTITKTVRGQPTIF